MLVMKKYMIVVVGFLKMACGYSVYQPLPLYFVMQHDNCPPGVGVFSVPFEYLACLWNCSISILFRG